MYFRYNADGIRTYKSHYDHNTLDMYHVNYVLDGTKIVSESYTHEITNATYTINYYYDANDSVWGSTTTAPTITTARICRATS